MDFEAVRSGDITLEHLNLFREIVRVVDAIEGELTCHEVCLMIEAVYPGVVEHITGWFFRKGHAHSWLVVSGSETIIDPYPIAGARPLIVTTAGAMNPWRGLYIAKEPEMVSPGSPTEMPPSRTCSHCRKLMEHFEGRSSPTADDWFVPAQLAIDGPCLLCDDCLDEAKSSMTDDEREFFDID